MSPAYDVLAFEGATGGRYRLYAPAQTEVLRRRFADFCRRPTLPRTPLSVLELDDVVLEDSPAGLCLYDARGRRILESCVTRYSDDGLAELWRARETVDSRPIDERIETPVLYSGTMFRHWGHFLLESMSRAWAASLDPRLANLPSVFSWSIGAGAPGRSYRDFIEAAGFNPAFADGEPRKLALKRCFVPIASFATSGYADPLHLTAPHRAAWRLLREPARDARPIYFSRANLKPHADARPTVRNEEELERALAARGARVVRMESLTLPEQIEVMNAHSVFIGSWGSALHNTLFSLCGAEVSTFVLIGRFLPTNFMLVDAIVGNAAHYLVTLSRADDFEESRQVLVDVEATLSYLEANGLF